MRTLSILLLFWVSVVHASDDIERAELAKFAKEIDFLIAEVDQLKRHGDEQSRMVFQYDDMKADLVAIRSGISSFIQSDVDNGHVIEPLKAIYK
ncbi:MAG: hypothetical protein QG652_1213 [Pseudomonadota bacterium]|nr:hypothetical protein [Pseudomonadota bacterium]